MNVLVTGGAGFIGSHLVLRLLELNHDVWVIDDLSNSTLKNLVKVFNKINFIKLSINDELPKIDFDVVFHLAAKKSVPQSFENPNDYFLTNIQGSYNIFETYKSSRIINVSSSSVEFLKSPYAISKDTVEKLGRLFSNVVSLRFYNVFGEHQLNEGAVIPAFIENVLTNKQCIIYGDGEFSRDFTYVGDVAEEVIEYGLGKKRNLQNIGDNAFCLGYNNTITINELFGKVCVLCNKKGKVKHSNVRKGDVEFSRSPHAIKKVYGFDEGLKRTVEFWKLKYI